MKYSFNSLEYWQVSSIIDWMRFIGLYNKSFPRNERKPIALLKAKQKEGVSDIWCISQNGEFVALVSTVNNDEYILLDYLAVSVNKRCNGIGSEVLKLIRNHYVNKGVFVEIELVLDGVDNYNEKYRRKQFYLRSGMHELNVKAKLFGVDMELLGYDVEMNFNKYRNFLGEKMGEYVYNRVEEIIK